MSFFFFISSVRWDYGADLVGSLTDVLLNPHSLLKLIHTLSRWSHFAPKSKSHSFLRWCESHEGTAVTRFGVSKILEAKTDFLLTTYHQVLLWG